MFFLGKLWVTEASLWVEAARQCAHNPIFLFLQLVSKRRSARQKWYQKGAPLIIGTVPVLIWVGFVVYEYLRWGYTSGFQTTLEYAPLVFLVLSYVTWAATGMNLAILDAMSLLRQSTKQAVRYELDDLAWVTLISDRDFVAGFLGQVLPQLYLRIVAGVVLAWLIMLLISTQWFSSYSQDTWTLIALAPISIGLWSASGCLGVTALLAFYLALGSGRSTIPASLASLVIVGNQGMWLLMSYGLLAISGGNSPGNVDNYVELFSSYSSSLLAPVLVILLIVLGLRLAFRYPELKLVQAIGSPLLVPFLAMIFVILVVVNIDTYSLNNALYISLLTYIWHLGNMLPLNFAILAHPVFYTGNLMDSVGGTLNLWYRPVTIGLAQLALLYICLGYAKRAVAERRQAN